MNKKNAIKVYDRLEAGETNIKCVVSSSKIQGDAVIVDAVEWETIEFMVKMPTSKEIKEIPCYGVELG